MDEINIHEMKSRTSFDLTFYFSSVLRGPQGLLGNAGEEVGELLDRWESFLFDWGPPPEKDC